MKKKTILLVGGGTGGHIVPVFEIYNQLKKYQSKLDIIVVGSGNQLERRFFEDNYDYKKIIVGKINRRLTTSNIIEFIKTFLGIIQVLAMLLIKRPHLIFSKGGYVSFPVIFWAKILSIPYFIHESDIEIGLSNRYALSMAKKAFVSFPKEFYPKNKNVIYSGHILQEKMLGRESKEYDTFNFLIKKDTILVIGGSQGSRTINDNIIPLLSNLLPRYNIIHQTGALDYDRVRAVKNKLDADLSGSYYVTDFLFGDIMIDAVNLANVVVARAGGTIAELGVKGKAMVLIPYSHAASDHQTKNANYLVENHAALVMEDGVYPDKLEKLIDKAASEKEVLEANASKLFKADGLKTIVDCILKEIEVKL